MLQRVNFKHVYLFWCFLELFYWKFILNINNEHVQDYSCPGATFMFCSHGEKLPQQGGLPGVVQWVTRLSKLPRATKGPRPLESIEFPDWVQLKEKNTIMTLKDSQQLGPWDRLEFYISQRPLTTLKDHQRPCRFICVIWKQNKMPLATVNDPVRPSMTDSKFGAKSSNLNDNFERPLMTMKDCQWHWKTANDWQWFPTTQILQWPWKTIKGTQWPVTTIWKPGLSRQSIKVTGNFSR